MTMFYKLEYYSLSMDWINSLKKTNCLSFMTELRRIGITSLEDFMAYESKDGKSDIAQATTMSDQQINKLFVACKAFDDSQVNSPHHSDNDEKTHFDGTAWIYDSLTDSMAQKCVAQQLECVKLVPLIFDDNIDNNNIKEQVKGGKGIEENIFSCGMLEMPPGSKKQSEFPIHTETFFVNKCEKKKLLFKVGDENELYL